MREVEYFLNDIEKSKSRPYIIGNEELTDKIFLYVKEKYPEALLFKLENQQYIVISNRGKNKLLKMLQKRKEQYEKSLQKIDNAISKLIGN